MKKRSQRRSGAAVVELAISLPLLLTLVFATIETCKMISLKKELSIACYEAARVGILPGATPSEASERAEMFLADRGIEGYTVTLEPASFAAATPGDALKVVVKADCSMNSVIGDWYTEKTIEESITMLFE